MKITEEQKSTLDTLTCVRLDDSNVRLLDSVASPQINGQDTSIVELFRNRQELEANRNKTLASYLVTDNSFKTRQPVVLLFFSIRCGELFNNETISSETIELASDMLAAIDVLMKKKDSLTPSECLAYYKTIQKAIKNGIGIDEAESIIAFHRDMAEEPSTGINRVMDVYSGIELKLFGINEKARELWASYNMPRSMGETLFWRFVVPKIEKAIEIVGAEYLYLFAADNTPDGHLINYYRNRLHLDSNGNLSTNKPRFDYCCRFLYQNINELQRQAVYFFENFTPEDVV